MTDDPPVRRRIVGAALRRFREQAGCTLDDAARILDCGRSKISRIETGQRGIRGTELQELLAGYGVDEPRRGALLSLARQPRQDGWWQSSRHVRDGFIGLGGADTTIGTYDAQLMPGLLQTRDYARAIAAASLVKESEEEREQFVQARLAQQHVLTRDQDPPQFRAVLGEGALRQMAGGPDVMRAQLRHLIDISDRQRNVSLQVLPFAAGAHAATSGPFVIVTFPGAPDLAVVYLEGPTGGIYLDSEDEVARYTLAFEHLRATALSTAATVSLIEEVAAET
ncbi:MAG: helix-turn-helix transcriptional regulator [Streptosporangiaceae bacterium]|jgi:transcriptional regulator with XRE-family HTH domain